MRERGMSVDMAADKENGIEKFAVPTPSSGIRWRQNKNTVLINNIRIVLHGSDLLGRKIYCKQID